MLSDNASAIELPVQAHASAHGIQYQNQWLEHPFWSKSHFNNHWHNHNHIRYQFMTCEIWPYVYWV